MWTELPADPPPPANPNVMVAGQPRHHTKADARLDIARSLSLPAELRPLDAIRSMGSVPWLEALTR